MKPLQIDLSTARGLYPDASPEFRTLLEKNFTKKELAGDVTERIHSYEDACADLGRKPMDEDAFADFMRKFLIDQGVARERIESEIQAKICYMKLETITEAYNDGDFLDWNDSTQRKYYSWFNFDTPSGFALDVTDCDRSYAAAGNASRLCFKSAEHARDAAQKFSKYYKAIIDNRPWA